MTEPDADRRPAAVAHSQAAPPSRPRAGYVHFGPAGPGVQLRLSRNIIPSNHLFLILSRCILRSCVIRPHAHPCPNTCGPSGSAAHFPPPPVPSRVRTRIRPAAHISLRHALRACSVRKHDCFFPPNRCYAHLLGTLALAMARNNYYATGAADAGPRYPSHEL